ncbi:MAG: hypothetical protein QGH45_24620 [Myxococcota bacterium]|nr:hypothetical protein [Myxococcota bacterium]
MHTRSLITMLCLTIVCALALPAAAIKADKAIKKLPDEDRQMILALKIYMAEDELEAYLTLDGHDARVDFLEETGYLRKWNLIREEFMPHVVKRQVVKGMNKDELWMTWGKPVQVRQTFYEKAYVDIYTYFFYEDRKGNAIPTPDRDDPLSYNRPQWEMNVYFHNDKVVSILEEGELFSPQDLSNQFQPLPDAVEKPEPVAEPDPVAGTEAGSEPVAEAEGGTE